MADYTGSSMAALAARHAQLGVRVLSSHARLPSRGDSPRRVLARVPRARARFAILFPPSGNALARAFPAGTPGPSLTSRVLVTVRPPVSRVLPHATSTTEVLRRAGERDGRARELLSARARRRAARAPPPGAPGDGRARRAEPPFLQVRRRRAGGVVVRGGPHGRDPPALDGDPPQGLRAPARPRGGPRAAGVLLQLRQRGRAPLPQAGRGDVADAGQPPDDGGWGLSAHRRADPVRPPDHRFGFDITRRPEPTPSAVPEPTQGELRGVPGAVTAGGDAHEVPAGVPSARGRAVGEPLRRREVLVDQPQRRVRARRRAKARHPRGPREGPQGHVAPVPQPGLAARAPGQVPQREAVQGAGGVFRAALPARPQQGAVVGLEPQARSRRDAGEHP